MYEGAQDCQKIKVNVKNGEVDASFSKSVPEDVILTLAGNIEIVCTHEFSTK